MRCPNCGNENPPDYVFCDECGARLQPLEGEAGTEQAAPGGGPAYGGPAIGDGVPSGGPAAEQGSPAEEAAPALEPDQPRGEAEAAAPAVGTAEEPALAVETPAHDAWQEPEQAPAPAVEEPVPATEDTIPPAEEQPYSAGEQVAPEEEYPPMQVPGTYTDTYAAPPSPGPAPEAEGAPQAAAGAPAGGREWAQPALDQFNQAQDALSRSDWVGFGTAMAGLRTLLQNAIQGGEGAAAVPAATVTPAPGGYGAQPAPEMMPEAPVAPSTYEEAAPAPVMEAPAAQEPVYGAEAPAAEEEAPVPPVEPQAEAGTLGVGVPGVTPSGVPQEAEPVLARLVMIATGAELPIPDQDEITVGREDPSSGIFPDIDLTPYGGEEGGVSRRHARMLRIGGEYYVEDMQSTNYTKLDGQRLPAHVRERLEDGARLDFGRVATIFRTS